MRKFNFILILIVAAVIVACGQHNSTGENDSTNIKILEQIDSNKKLNSVVIDTDNFSFKKFSFTLTNENQICLLTYKTEKTEKKLILNIPAPCKVIRFGSSKKPNGDNVRYWGNSKIKVFMVGGNVRKEKCKYETAFSYQAVVILTNDVKLGDKSDGWICLPDGPDDTEYSILSETVLKKKR